MSLYLGKIHYWLFNKIMWFEDLTDILIRLAEDENINVTEKLSEINSLCGEKLPKKPLEELIDTSNIHGWLQGEIHSSERRLASWVKVLIDNGVSMNKIEEVFTTQGIKAGTEVKETKGVLNSACDIYTAVNDYLLDGMPCDRVDVVTDSTEDLVKWSKRICVHKPIWDEIGADVNIFYDLRNAWTKAFVNEINSDFNYEGNETYIINRK